MPKFPRELLVLAAVAACPSHAAHHIFTADSAGDTGSYSSMQLNGGNPVISYHDNGNASLKLATCTAACGTPAATWVTTTVDRAGSVGMNTSLQLNRGNPVIAYHDVTKRALKLATCTAGCATATPEWTIVFVDQSSVDTGRFPSLHLNGGNPVISYRDRTNGSLKLATCTAACASPEPTWVITTVDRAGDVGRFTSMQLDDGRPVIAYFDYSAGNMKLATCTAGCATASPTWAFSVIDHVPGDLAVQLSLQLDAGKPVVSYPDVGNRNLKLATCTAGCATPSATWVISVVARGGNAAAVSPSQQSAGESGTWSSLQLRGGKPVIAYYGSMLNCTTTAQIMSCGETGDLLVAACTADCASATPTWAISTVDNTGIAGWEPSLLLDGDRGLVSYYDASAGDLRVAVFDLASASLPVNHTALWWNRDEAGWGVNFTHQGDIVFGTLFTYDNMGSPMWLVLSAGVKQPDGTFAGTLYRTTGPPFNARPFTPIGPADLTSVGSMNVRFAGDSATLLYSVDGIKVQKTIRKQVFGAHAATCRPGAVPPASLANYQGLWWNAAESGWGLNITHQGDVTFATLFTYDAAGNGVWFVLSAGLKQADGSYRGDLYRTRGPAFNAAPFTPIAPANLTRVGTMQLIFASGENGTLSYSVDGAAVVKAITRQVFASPLPACS